MRKHTSITLNNLDFFNYALARYNEQKAFYEEQQRKQQELKDAYQKALPTEQHALDLLESMTNQQTFESVKKEIDQIKAENRDWFVVVSAYLDEDEHRNTFPYFFLRDGVQVSPWLVFHYYLVKDNALYTAGQVRVTVIKKLPSWTQG